MVDLTGRGHIGTIGVSGGFEYLGNGFSIEGGFASGLGADFSLRIIK